MRQDYIHICIVLDASGSMSPMEKETRQILKDFIYKEKQQPGKTVLDVYQFNNDVRHLLKSIDLSNVDNRFVDHYSCCGCTAMNDAICIAIDELGKKFSEMPECDRPADILVAILTDGEENASRRFTAADVKQRITHQRDVYSWQFMFLAANQDAVLSGGDIGIRADDCLNFEPSAMGVMYCMDNLNMRSASTRTRRRENNER